MHPMKYRILWTWDSWLCDPFSAQSYVSEYKKLIDWMAQWDYNGLIIWGFLDDRHGGEESAREIARYGKEKGIKILPGVGAGGYDGFFVHGEHPYHLPTFLRERPELMAHPRHKPDKPSDWWGCLYQEGMLEWLREGAKWLAKNFDIDGVNIETNEMWNIDVCEHAAKATEQEPNRLKYGASFSDLAIAVPIIHEEIKKQHPDAWITYATYEPMWWHRQEDGWLLKDMPEDSIAQWNCEMDTQNDGVPPPVKQNISLIHSGGWSYHLKSFPPIWAFTQYRCFLPAIEQARDFARNQRGMEMDGFVLGNAGSADMPDNEINYIAFNEFSRNPEMTIDEFSTEFITRLYGEKAEPLVKELMLKQPEVHKAAGAAWRSWAEFMNGNIRRELATASEEAIEALNGQMELALRAHQAASDDGKRRLDTVIHVLGEWWTICELSVDPRLESLRTQNKTLSEEELNGELQKFVEITVEAGLPEDIYGYTGIAGR